MNDIYKILLAAAVGFLLSPLTEVLKSKISARQNKSKLKTKLTTFETILCRAIPSITETIKNRERFIKAPEKYLGTVFITPNFRFPKIESNIDNAYDMLSTSQRRGLLDLESQAAHIKDMLKKLYSIEEECKSTIYKKANIEKIITQEAEIRDIEKEHYTRAIACEKAILYTAACMLGTLRRAINNDSSLPKDIDTIEKVSKELDIDIDLNWWPQFRGQKSNA
ncbi:MULTISPECIES: hypothetical protein [Pseudomonas]|uniref:Uncharacterized protein n=1 Tax=Pseudomonas reactans TaxID=117680 RepID=A0A7Y8FZB0_9PSED|nr:hypothetical protein [Pseudomonas reactans]NWE87899.1 hypothetical protein [Pseudomonas reactans]